MSGQRTVKTRLRTAKGRPLASTLWLERQLNDPFVQRARAQGWRARSVFKLEEIDRRFGLIRRGMAVLDLGAAPGSWTQYAAAKGARVVAIDLLPMEPVAGAVILQGDAQDPAMQDRLAAALGGPADLVLSDIAANATGTRAIDRLRAEGVAEAVLEIAGRLLAPGGACLIKLVKGAEANVRARALQLFRRVELVRPAATRKDSSETFLLALDRRPGDAAATA
jgi:23S rRNA (uridine2552-2'-O)-methyltransferase